MRKFHWISMALLVAPFAFAGACGGDDTTGGGTAGSSSNAGNGGNAGTGSQAGASGSATTGGASGTSSMAGSAGSGGSGMAGTAGSGGSAAPDSGGGGSSSSDAAAEAATDDGSSTKCTLANDPGNGKSCLDLCVGYFKVCKTHAATADTYANQAACVTACKALTQVQLCCRAQHSVTISTMNNGMPSMADLTTHCPHVIGMAPCT